MIALCSHMAIASHCKPSVGIRFYTMKISSIFQMHSKRNQHIYWFPDVGMRSMYGDRGSFNVSIDIYIYISIWINVLWEWANIQLTAIFRYVLRQDDSEITELHHALIWFSNLALTFDSTCAYYFQICTFSSCLFFPTYCFTLKSGRKTLSFFFLAITTRLLKEPNKPIVE